MVVAQDFFNQSQNAQSNPLVQDIFKRGESQARRASSGIERALTNRGFGGSTFIDPLKVEAGAQARQTFVQQGFQTAEQIRQNNINNFFKQSQLDEEKRAREEENQWNWLTGLGSTAEKLGAFNPLENFLKDLFKPQPTGATRNDGTFPSLGGN